MQNAVLVGLSRQVALARELDVVANNIANINTTGFKADGSLFEEFLSSSARADGPAGRVSFVRDRGVWHDMSQGPIEHTGNPLDVAVDGKGFLVVQTPRGERYTRNGSMQINATGQLVTSDGYPVLGDGGPITLQPTDSQVSDQPRRHHQRARRHFNVDSLRGKLKLVTFDNAAAPAERRQQHFQTHRNGATAATCGEIRRHSGRDRKIECARRRRDVAHDRNHPQLHPDRQPSCSSRAIMAQSAIDKLAEVPN